MLYAILYTKTGYHINLISHTHNYYYNQFPTEQELICVLPIFRTPTRPQMRTGSGVDLINTRPSPVNVKADSQFEILSTVVNNSPDEILLPAANRL